MIPVPGVPFSALAPPTKKTAMKAAAPTAALIELSFAFLPLMFIPSLLLPGRNAKRR